VPDELLVPGSVIRLEVRGRKFPVSVDVRGHFTARFDSDRNVYGDTLEKVRVQLMRLTKVARVKLNIPFTTMGPMFRDMVCTGRHASNGHLIVVEKEHGNTMDQWNDYGQTVLQPLTPDQRMNYRHLLDKVAASEAALKAFEKPLSFDLSALVRKQLEATLAEEGL